MWAYLVNILADLGDKYIPERKLNKNGYLDWIAKKISKGIKQRNRKWKRFQKSPSFESEMSYKKIRNKVKNEIRKAKK